MSGSRNMIPAVTDRTRPLEPAEVPHLISGTQLTCPACEAGQPILAYTQFRISDKYAAQCLPVLKCRECRFVFALVP